MSHLRNLILLASLLILASPYVAPSAGICQFEDNRPRMRTIDLSAADKVQEVNRYYSLDAHGPTQMFFSFSSEKAVIQVTLANTSPQIKPLVNIHLFSLDTSQERIDHWINNRHSDAQYPNAAKPIRTVVVDSKYIKTTITGPIEHEVAEGGDEYEKYTVDFSLDEFTDDNITFRKSKSRAQVFVKTKELTK